MSGGGVVLEDFIGKWRDSLGNDVHVEWARPNNRGGQLDVTLQKPRGGNVIKLNVKSLGHGRFCCGHYDLDERNSDDMRIIWEDSKNRSKTSIWDRQGSPPRNRHRDGDRGYDGGYGYDRGRGGMPPPGGGPPGAWGAPLPPQPGSQGPWVPHTPTPGAWVPPSVASEPPPAPGPPPGPPPPYGVPPMVAHAPHEPPWAPPGSGISWWPPPTNHYGETDWRTAIAAMYQRFNPDKLLELEAILKKYRGSETSLYQALIDKYIPQSVSPFDPQPPPGSVPPVFPWQQPPPQAGIPPVAGSYPPDSRREDSQSDASSSAEEAEGDDKPKKRRRKE
eukprot:gnl/TRDRNA2_/TRDRNA2_42909_c0_seq1.p1 gnl/TRDRNA2_/TRDRNA2_42909_c0~~gnl/TRDRNA2_/TRDRNA2_42909_c0_seq1.p1  ORF type:complete len:364 (+),score=53.58 gnl/TRDRNA2_/TRDRNA2_42909_c0_seq1:94-1092(+)